MKLLYVLERYPELSQTFVAQELVGLAELGVETSVVALSPGTGGLAPAPAAYANAAGPVRRIASAAGVALAAPSAAWHQLTDETAWPPPGGSRRLRGLARLAPLVAGARKADHIHAHFATEATDIARLLSRLSGTPFSFTAHATDAYGPPDELSVNIGAARFARACSGHVAERLTAAAGSLPARVVTLGVAIDFTRFERTTRWRPDGPIVSVGRLVEKKGFLDLVTAFASLGDTTEGRRLQIIGEGPQRQALEALIDSTGAPVDLLGPLPNESVANILHSASLFALTPRTAADGDRDGRPAAIAEAMAAGLPILSTSQPGIPELVSDDCGRLAIPGDSESIASGLADLLARSPATLEAMGRAGSARSRDLHSRDRIAARMLDLFRSA